MIRLYFVTKSNVPQIVLNLITNTLVLVLLNVLKMSLYLHLFMLQV